jgi:hypothetical protein
MKYRSILSALFVVVLAGLIFHPLARADEWNQMTKFHFNQPIELPGRVLPAGSYWFVLGDYSDRNLVDIYNSNWTQRLATLITAPAKRLQTTDDTQVKLAERPHHMPEALLKWYYPGDSVGHEFLYSEKHAREFRHDPREDVTVPQLNLNPKRPVMAANRAGD